MCILLLGQVHVQGFTVVVQPQVSLSLLQAHCTHRKASHCSAALKGKRNASLVGVGLVRALGASALSLGAGATGASGVAAAEGVQRNGSIGGNVKETRGVRAGG